SLSSLGNFVTGFLKFFGIGNAYIGAYLLASFEDVLVSEDSAAVPLAQRVVTTLSKSDSKLDSAQLKTKFGELIDEKLRAKVRTSIQERVEESTTLWLLEKTLNLSKLSDETITQ